MKLILAVLVMFLVVGTQAQWYNFPVEAAQGAKDMWDAYRDMREANWKDSDKTERGPGGRWAARVISDARENLPSRSGSSISDSAADQEANRWGRNGGDPDRYRPKGLPKKY